MDTTPEMLGTHAKPYNIINDEDDWGDYTPRHAAVTDSGYTE